MAFAIKSLALDQGASVRATKISRIQKKRSFILTSDYVLVTHTQRIGYYLVDPGLCGFVQAYESQATGGAHQYQLSRTMHLLNTKHSKLQIQKLLARIPEPYLYYRVPVYKKLHIKNSKFRTL
jgi:hypothetical protein